MALNSSGDEILALNYCCTTPDIFHVDVAINGTQEGSEPTIKLESPRLMGPNFFHFGGS